MSTLGHHLQQLLILLIFVTKCYSEHFRIEDDIKNFTYNAAVVEYHPVHNSKMSYEEKVNYTVTDYIKLLKEIKEDVDIVVFPEATLIPLTLPLSNKPISEIPDPYSEVLCNSTNPNYEFFLKQLSCAAMTKGTTLVVNLIEKERCSLLDSGRFCPQDGIVYYNSDVVFNEEGTISARYRKYNLFGEKGLSPPLQAEIVNFMTKNEETFGIFTCFDIMFKKPALILPKNGIRNIIFPTMWFSELPYLTALQVQQMWAQENNVTLISAGANNPREGTGGSGIFIGSKGSVNQTYVGENGGTRVLVHRVPKIEIIDNPFINKILPLEDDIDALAESLDDFYLMQDPSLLKGHTSILLNTKENEITEEVCNGAGPTTCCHFHIRFSHDKNPSEDKKVYTYHLAAFNGVRSFGGVRNGGIEACAVLACLNSSINSCGKRFSKYRDVQWPLTFEQINVSAQFLQNNDRIQYPNSVLASLRSISPQYTSWIREEAAKNFVRRDHVLNKPHKQLLTFGIYGRDFSRDSPHPSSSETIKSSNVTAILLLILSIVLSIKMCV